MRSSRSVLQPVPALRSLAVAATTAQGKALPTALTPEHSPAHPNTYIVISRPDRAKTAETSNLVVLRTAGCSNALCPPASDTRRRLHRLPCHSAFANQRLQRGSTHVPTNTTQATSVYPTYSCPIDSSMVRSTACVLWPGPGWRWRLPYLRNMEGRHLRLNGRVHDIIAQRRRQLAHDYSCDSGAT